MAYLIDGHNLIPHVPGLSLRAMEDERQLIELLQVFCQVTRKSVEVYFDGAPAGQARTRSFGMVKAHFVRLGMTADDAIANRLRRLDKAAANWSVVSSDRRVQSEARDHRAQIIPSEEFARKLIDAQQYKPVRKDASASSGLSDAELDDWLRLFQSGDENKD